MKKFVLLFPSILMFFSVHSQNLFFDYGEFIASEDVSTVESSVIYFDNGNVKEYHALKDGFEHGEVVYYYKNGTTKESGNYNNGVKFGKWTSWTKDGIKTGEVSYDLNGKKDGKWKVWDNQGNIRAQMSYKNGERSGLWKTWDENGSVINEKRF